MAEIARAVLSSVWRPFPKSRAFIEESRSRLRFGVTAANHNVAGSPYHSRVPGATPSCSCSTRLMRDPTPAGMEPTSLLMRLPGPLACTKRTNSAPIGQATASADR